MKRYKTILILLGVLAVALIATVIVTKVEDRKEQIKNTDEVILSVSADSVESLTWDYAETSLAFRKTDKWHWSEDEAFPVDDEAIGNLLSTFAQFGAAFIIEDVEDFGQYGLDDPTCTIRFSTADTDYEVVLGAFSTMDAQRYVSIGDGNVYLVKTDPFDAYEIELRDLILNDDTPSFDKITALQFSGTENYSAVREEESTATCCAADLYFTEQNGKTVPLDTYRVEDYCADISLLDLSDYVSYNVTAEELAAWGLDTPELSVTVDYTYTDETDSEAAGQFVLHVGRNQEALAEKEAADAAGEEYTDSVPAYVRVGDSQIVYQISEDDYNALIAAAYNDLRHNEVLTADFADVSQISVSLDGTTYSVTSELAKDDTEDTIEVSRVYYFGGEELDITNLKSAVSALSVSEFSDLAPTEKEEIRITFYLDNENFPQIPVTLYRYDGESCIAEVNGEIMGLVSRTSVVDLMEAVNAIVLG